MQPTFDRRPCSVKLVYADGGDVSGLQLVVNLRSVLFEAYDLAADLDLESQVQADMAALYKYAQARPVGFGLLFDDATSDSRPNGDRGSATYTQIRDELIGSLTERIADRVRAYSIKHGGALGQSADLLGAMLVGMAVHGARQAIRLGADTLAVGELAASLAASALRHLDPALLSPIDRSARHATPSA